MMTFRFDFLFSSLTVLKAASHALAKPAADSDAVRPAPHHGAAADGLEVAERERAEPNAQPGSGSGPGRLCGQEEAGQRPVDR